MEEVRDCASLLNAFINRMQAFGKKVHPTKSTHLVQIHLDHGEVLTDAVVKIACKPATLFILRLQQANRQPSQRTGAFLDEVFELGIAETQGCFGLFSLRPSRMSEHQAIAEFDRRRKQTFPGKAAAVHLRRQTVDACHGPPPRSFRPPFLRHKTERASLFDRRQNGLEVGVALCEVRK